MRNVMLLACICAATICFAAPLPCLKPGVARWPIKTSLPTGATTIRMTLAGALSDSKLPPLPNVKENDPRYQSTRISDQPVREDKLITIKGWLYLVAFELDDCDFHIQISPQPRTITNKPTASDNCMIVELPSGQYAANPQLGAQFETMRQWVIDRLLARTPPKIGSVHVMRHPVYVSVSGALFYDDAHHYKPDHTTGRGKRGMDSKTLWELHPITAIAFAPKPKIGSSGPTS
jgi:hypothetical protein